MFPRDLNIYLHEDPSYGMTSLYLVTGEPSRRRLLVGGSEIPAQEGGVFPEPSLRLHPSELDALAAKIIGVRPRATEVEDILRDAIEDARKLRDQALGVLLAPQVRQP